MTQDNYVTIKFQCHQIKFCWNRAMPVHVGILSGRFRAPTVEKIGRRPNGLQNPGVYCLALCRHSVRIPDSFCPKQISGLSGPTAWPLLSGLCPLQALSLCLLPFSTCWKSSHPELSLQTHQQPAGRAPSGGPHVWLMPGCRYTRLCTIPPPLSQWGSSGAGTDSFLGLGLQLAKWHELPSLLCGQSASRLHGFSPDSPQNLKASQEAWVGVGGEVQGECSELSSWEAGGGGCSDDHRGSFQGKITWCDHGEQSRPAQSSSRRT